MCSQATRDRYCRTYGACSASIRRRLGLTVVMLFVCAVSVFASSDGNEPEAKWLTPQNILTVGVLVYHLGMLRSQFNDVQKRLEKFENSADDTYAPKEETFRRLEHLERRRGNN